MEIKNIPTAEVIQKSINKLQNYEWPILKENDNINEYIKTLTSIFTSEFQNLLDYVEVIKPSDFNLNIFRARELSTFADRNLFCEHSYKPLVLTKDRGRCHFPHHPVFYGSTNALVALTEVIRENDFTEKKFCISNWEIIKDNTDILFQPLLFSDLHPDNPYNILKNVLNLKINQPFKGKLNEDQVEGIRLYLSFLGNLFVNDKDYFMSASFAHRRLYDSTKLKTEILMYPSVQSLSKGVNLAIHPNFVDNRMKVIRFYIVTVKMMDKDSGKMSIVISEYGEAERSSIRWSKLSPDDEIYKEFMKSDFGYDGEIVLTLEGNVV